MRKSLWIMLAVMVVAASAPNAHADDVTLDVSGTFTASSGGASCSSTPPSCVLGGTIEFNNVTGAIISEDVTFTGASPTAGPFNFVHAFIGSGVNTLLELTNPDESTGEVDLYFVTPTPGSFVGYAGGSLNTETLLVSNSNALWVLSSGSLTPAVTAPEPSSVALMLLGVGLVFGMRKRIGQRLPQAS